MKKLLVLMMVLAMAGMANAALLLSVDGVVDPPDTQIEIAPSDEVIIDIWGDGLTDPYAFLLGIAAGDGSKGSLDISGATVLYPGSEAAIMEFDDQGTADMLGLENPFVYIELTDVAIPPAPLDGTLVDGIVFHCEALGDVTLVLLDGDGMVMDTQVIHQIPEPMTVALLGLGGLLLRRRK
jgi:hypothetical protein